MARRFRFAELIDIETGTVHVRRAMVVRTFEVPKERSREPDAYKLRADRMGRTPARTHRYHYGTQALRQVDPRDTESCKASCPK